MAVKTPDSDVQASIAAAAAAIAAFLAAIAAQKIAAAQKSGTQAKPLFDATEVGKRVQERAQATEAAEKAAAGR